MGDASAHHRMHITEIVLAGGGEMAALMRAQNWSQTSLGPVEDWPQSLRTAISICLHSRFPILIWWGSELAMLYNDAYRPMLGALKHPQALGAPGRAIWPEIWDIIGPMLAGVLEAGIATYSEDILLLLERHGYAEECYFTFSYSPLRDETGSVGGVFCAVTETTGRVLGERRLRTLRDLADHTIAAKTEAETCARALDVLADNRADLPFTALYLLDATQTQAQLIGTTGLPPGSPAAPANMELTDPSLNVTSAWPLTEVVRTGASARVDDLSARFGALPNSLWDVPPHTGVVLPIAAAGQTQLAGLLVVGVSPHRALDDDYRDFLGLVAGQLATAIADARAYEAERQRAESLAELDRAKTIFFSNISHEFRTPLTLLLGPIEDVLADAETTPANRERMALIQRNALRLLKLVNSLLDFSRIEAGRIEATYEPTDLAELTVELTSVFRAAIERAGLKLIVNCPPLAEPVYVDREMWEKIVFNLLSNAFKFTFAGTIQVSLRQVDELIELTVRDTGTGIPAEELPRLFERFHRVAGARGRTFEGTGIGLALVQELVRLHGGSVRIESEVDQGSMFTVAIPRGSTHLPADHIGSGRTLASTALGSAAYVEEALRWLPNSTTDDGRPTTDDQPDRDQVGGRRSVVGGRILLADDNADMREYMRRLLSAHYAVEAVADGVAALAAARERPPDLILTDVMMPHLDGFGLIKALRADERLKTIPVLLLSARAGEESKIEGLEAGADDYLVKPFAARELLARVNAHIEVARVRREAAQALRENEDRLRMAVEAGAIGIWDIDLRTGVRTWSERGKAIYGLAPDERMDYQRQLELTHPDDRARVDELVTAFRDQGTLSRLDFEHRIVRPDGSLCWVAVRGEAIYDGGQLPVRLIGTIVDITDHKRAEEALQKSEAEYRQLADAMPQLVWTSAPDGAVDYYNSRVAEYAGIARAVGGGWSWQPMLHQDDLQPTLAAWQAAAQSGQLYSFEHRLQMNDGSFRWHLSRALPARDADGRIVKWFGTTTDIHEQKQVEQDLRFMADLAELIRLADDPKQMLDKVAQALAEHFQVRRCLFIEIDEANDRGLVRSEYCRGVPSVAREYKLSGYSSTALVEIEAGHSIVNHDSQRDPRTAAFYEATYQPNGERAYVAVPLMRDGHWNGTLWVSDDVPRQWQAREIALLETVAERVWLATEKLRAEQALRANEERLQILYSQEQAARAQAEAASRLKDEFLATVSHELRTPLTSILGYGQMLQTRKREEAYVVRTAEKIVRSAKSQAQLIDDLLDVSRIVTGKLRIEPRTIDMLAVIQAAIDAVRPAIDAKAIRLDTDFDPALGLIVGDPDRLQQVVWNLLSNAVKFTPSGGMVRVRLEVYDDNLQLTVSDTGQGISAEFLPYVFDRFRQAESTSTRAHGGLGLGLSIVRHLVEMHGGTVQVQSEGVGMGATFTVRLPIVADAAGNHRAPDMWQTIEPCSPALDGLRILVVDDQPDIVELLRDILTSCGAMIRTSTTARDALAMLCAWRPDILVSDIAMPGDDGYWLIDNIRALTPEAGGATPAVALTAYVRVEDRMRVLAAGFQRYVPKPVEPAELLDIVAHLAETSATGVA